MGLGRFAPWALCTLGANSWGAEREHWCHMVSTGLALVGLPLTDCSSLSACSSSSTAPKVQQLGLRDLSLVSCSQLRSCCIGLMPAPVWAAEEAPPGEPTSFVEVETSVKRKHMTPGCSIKCHMHLVLLSRLHVSILSHHL